MTIDLSDKQCEELVELLESRVSEIGPEIHHASDFRVKDWLREKRRVLDELLNRLKNPTIVA